ncbi:NTE family protein [Mesonia hippocampi]|uniref:NTE family protein n=1 Tax=Mesonia hippocampi TaxID=1628250 RepID=A0A840EQW6_9FLAO|nr:patatin-like phospholipase family protein [Mesonia hippocampi]MBB4119350.1 NTE family protein [Mesonia hippocampi]
MKKVICCLVFIMWIGLWFTNAQTKQNDIKVGLVLSGGGAKGLAHIGVLKVLEETGVRVDYVGGTSMGAMIGSLYAAGYSPQQLDSIFRSTNFEELIRDDLPRNIKSFYQKEEDERYAVSLPLEKWKIKVPSGLSKGQNVYNLLAQLMAPVAEINDFKELPIPFFCIGTNIETGEEVLFDKGDLPQVVAASGSIPSLFSPIKIDGKLIVDGGVVNNYPLEEMRKRGVNYIIGVDVQDSLVDRKKLKTAIEVMNQVNNFRTIKAMKGKETKTDLYIKPNITAFSILSFDKGDAIIAEGEKVAYKHYFALKELASKQSKKQTRKPLELQNTIALENINITGSTTFPRSYIKGKLKIKEGEAISYTALNEGINRLSATGNFQKIEYKLKSKPSNKQDLILKIEESKKDASLRLALHYDELYKSAALFNLTRQGTFFKNDILNLDFVFGDNIRYKFDYYIDKGAYWSVGLNSTLNKFDHDVRLDFLRKNIPDDLFNINKIKLEYLDLTNTFYAETFLTKNVKFGLGAEHKYTKLDTETILLGNTINTNQIPVTVLEESNLFGVLGYLAVDTYNNAYFPTRGFKFYGRTDIYLFETKSSFEFSEFSISKAYIGFALPISKKFSARLSSQGGFRIGETEMTTLNFFLGGYGNNYVNHIEHFLGYDYLAISGDSFIKTLFEIDYQPFNKHHLTASYNIANVDDDLFQDGDWFKSPKYTGFGLGYGVETILGPLEAKYTYSPELKEGQWFFSLGFWF